MTSVRSRRQRVLDLPADARRPMHRGTACRRSTRGRPWSRSRRGAQVAFGERLADDLLGAAEAVDRGGVDQRDAGSIAERIVAIDCGFVACRPTSSRRSPRCRARRATRQWENPGMVVVSMFIASIHRPARTVAPRPRPRIARRPIPTSRGGSSSAPFSPPDPSSDGWSRRTESHEQPAEDPRPLHRLCREERLGGARRARSSRAATTSSIITGDSAKRAVDSI